MPTLKYQDTPADPIAPGVERRLAYSDNLMLVVIDFDDGPTSAPDPYHSHPHEQVSYVAEGEIIFFLEGAEPEHLKPGDMFMAPSGVPHTIQRLTAHVRLVDAFTPIREEFLKQ
ncbi:MAG: cupin domain-containing protein [Chloroflexi bacterium]|nr:cupin domain-containing protein [Chloroflexota bacterium]